MGIHTEQAGYCSKQTSPKPTASVSAQEQIVSHVEIHFKVRQGRGQTAAESYKPLLGKVRSSQPWPLGWRGGAEPDTLLLTD